LKRLKRGHRDERDGRTGRDIGDIFDSDEEVAPVEDRAAHRGAPRLDDEFADFIEEDFSEGEEGRPADFDPEVARPARRGFDAVKDTAGLDEAAFEDFKEAFGDGTDYDWALALEEEEEDGRREDDDSFPKGIELKDVFEPSQLAERMLTDEDNEIRATDEPERFQIARKPYKHFTLTEQEFKEEAVWISNLMLPAKNLPKDLVEPFRRSVAKVLEFMITDEFEVPFIFQHRKDYLIHAVKVPLSPDPRNPDVVSYGVQAEKLLNQTELWQIFDFDLKFRALVDKRHALEKTYNSLKDKFSISDPIFEDNLPKAESMEELQDVQDYLHFQYSSRLADLNLMDGPAINGHKRPGASKMLFEKIRHGKVYGLVRAYGLTADAFAKKHMGEERHFVEDPIEKPDEMASSEDILDPPDYNTSEQCLRAARAMFAEELVMSPQMRKMMRRNYYRDSVVDCHRTDKGLKKIDEQHPYYEFKYLRNQSLQDIARQPELFLKMLRAEEEGLVEVRVRMQSYDRFKQELYKSIESDNFSAVADLWNRERREALDIALAKLHKLMTRGLKENLKLGCEDQIGKAVREEYSRKLDQAPYKPKGMVLGTTPRVLAMSNGTGSIGKEAISWAWVEEDGRVLENGKFTDLKEVQDPEREGSSDGADVRALVELVGRRRPDVIAMSGFSVDTMKLYEQIQKIVKLKDLRGADFEDENGEDTNEPLEVIIVNDEVARLYQTSDRAAMEHPGLAPLTRYCVALARYVQNPMKEYASLGKDIISISFDPCQGYVPQDKILKQLESAMVDFVNLVGVNVNEAMSDSYTANLLPYVCGLGPRKAQHFVKAVNHNGGEVITRAELVGDPEQHKIQAVGPRVWSNCASFLYIDFDSTEPESDYLDNTRVHPEDYDLGRKMAADALELDEEDVEAEKQQNGAGAVVRLLVKDDQQEKVNDLILEEYAEELEKGFNQKKRATLETIRAELQVPYEELRRNFSELFPHEIFTMFTGETRDSLADGMIVAMSIRKLADDFVEGRLDCGIEGTIPAHEISHTMDVSAKSMFQMHQTIQAKIVRLDRKNFTAEMSILAEKLDRPYKKDNDRLADEWDDRQEQKDKEAMQVKNDVSGRTQRVIKHPLFRSFNSAQAEEYLGSQAPGDVVIRPSSKGLDHLAVTWKVSDGVYQHIDVLELDKENEFSVGRTLKISGKYTYSDLDELIVNHVKAMAKKVDEMKLHEKYQNGTKAETGKFPSPKCLEFTNLHRTMADHVYRGQS
jgi:transcription elongation factor SPT6